MATPAGQSSAWHPALLRSVLSWPALVCLQPYQTRSHRDCSRVRLRRFRNDADTERCVVRDGGISNIGALSTNQRARAIDNSPAVAPNLLVFSIVRGTSLRA